jgi:hypothetical protein
MKIAFHLYDADTAAATLTQLFIGPDVQVFQLAALYLKGHGNEADFLGYLHKSFPHESLTLPFEPLQFWLRIR